MGTCKMEIKYQNTKYNTIFARHKLTIWMEFSVLTLEWIADENIQIFHIHASHLC